MQVLSRRTKNNPVLIGEPRVRKTAVVEGLAQAIVNGRRSRNPEGQAALHPRPRALVAGCATAVLRERLEEGPSKEDPQPEATSSWFIDELHTLVGAGPPRAAIDARSILNPMLARGELQTIGATTLDRNYRKHLGERSGSWSGASSRFRCGAVPGPHDRDPHGLRDRYEAHHRHLGSPTPTLVRRRDAGRPLPISDRFTPRGQGDRPSSTTAAPDAHSSHERAPGPARVRREIAGVRRDKESAIDAQDFEKAASLRDKEKTLLAEKAQREKEWKAGRHGRRGRGRRRADRRGPRHLDGHPGLQS